MKDFQPLPYKFKHLCDKVIIVCIVISCRLYNIPEFPCKSTKRVGDTKAKYMFLAQTPGSLMKCLL